MMTTAPPHFLSSSFPHLRVDCARMNRLLTTPNCSALIVLAGVLVYIWHINNGFLDLDDQTFIFKNPLVLEGSFSAPFSQFSNLLYIPLTVVTWQMTNAIFGMSSTAFHAIDLLLHLTNAVLAFLLLERLTQHKLGSFLAALVFVIHPLNSEAVYWASQRKDLLSAMFPLLSIHAYVRYLERDDLKWIVWSTVACIAALFTKVGSFPLPLLFLVMDYSTGRSFSWRWITEKLPMLIASLLFIYIGTLGAQQFLAPVGMVEVILLAAKGTAYQLFRFIGPWHTSPFLHQQTPVTLADPMFAISMIVSVIAGCAALFFFIKRKDPLLAIGSMWFFLFLAPTYTAAQKAGLLFWTSDKYGYVPMIGLLLVCVWIYVSFIEKHTTLKKVVLVLTGLWLALFGWRTFDNGYSWKDTVTLYERVVDRDEDNGLAHIGLGFLAAQAGDYEKAITHYEVSMQYDPENLVAYTNAAGSYRSLGKPEELADVLRKMLPHVTARQLKGDPSTVKVLLFAGREVLPSIDMELAREILTKLTELVPENPDVQAALR